MLRTQQQVPCSRHKTQESKEEHDNLLLCGNVTISKGEDGTLEHHGNRDETKFDGLVGYPTDMILSSAFTRGDVVEMAVMVIAVAIVVFNV